jgi:predicted anti-sigma-YlaC factor YlaD
MAAMNLLSVSCTEAARLISESQDAPLSLTDRVGLRLHLAICQHCRRYQRQIHLMRQVFSQYSDHLAPTRLPEEARQQIIRELEREGD